MNRKKEWTEEDFERMEWHDSRLYSISFPNQLLEMTLDIDYIVSFDEEKQMFELLPCEVVFYNIIDLTIELNFGDTTGIDITEIRRKQEDLLSNDKVSFWKYTIETDRGFISFKSTGYKQFSKQLSSWSKTYDLGRIKGSGISPQEQDD